jgi:hypothetical protein
MENLTMCQTLVEARQVSRWWNPDVKLLCSVAS